MVNFGLKKEVDKAYKIHYQLSPIIDYIFEEGNPAGIKAVLKIIGLCDDFVRLPLVSVTNQLKENIESFILNLKKK
jgi:4-hydroxy-tetrahydrodipicolinate synthase